jgi:hypothetical protein
MRKTRKHRALTQAAASNALMQAAASRAASLETRLKTLPAQQQQQMLVMGCLQMMQLLVMRTQSICMQQLQWQQRMMCQKQLQE